MKRKIKVSVIVPIYNVEKYIKKCLTSLINQTFKDIEILAISDGSNDNSVVYANEIAKKDERIKVIEKENGEYGSVLEYAISQIKSEYFLICDPDDWLEDNAIEILYNSAKTTKADLTVGDYYLFYSDSTTKDSTFCNDVYPLQQNKVYNDLTNFCFGKVSPHSKLYKTTYAKGISFPHKVSYTDTLLFYVYMSRIKTACYINEPLSNYYFDRPNNTMSELKEYKKKTFDQTIIVLDSILKQLNTQSNSFDSILCAIYYNYSTILNNLQKIKDKNDKQACYSVLFQRLMELKPYKKIIIKKIKSHNFVKTILKRIKFCILINKVKK